MAARIEGGPLAAAQAAARLLKITFTLPDEDDGGMTRIAWPGLMRLGLVHFGCAGGLLGPDAGRADADGGQADGRAA